MVDSRLPSGGRRGPQPGTNPYKLIVDCSKKQERHYQPVKINRTMLERESRQFQMSQDRANTNGTVRRQQGPTAPSEQYYRDKLGKDAIEDKMTNNNAEEQSCKSCQSCPGSEVRDAAKSPGCK
ncbi:hypothetical protein P4O66_006916 [Electrophorus voltai]|uniref:Uncharacterized protein n=1 Tax=Electrophorus voltai TaxID=2609070 RepID=A0AAD8ZI87_9TELE|nr:hypothetical protein P4O66_006916 [Electrophorus voltai]